MAEAGGAKASKDEEFIEVVVDSLQKDVDEITVQTDLIHELKSVRDGAYQFLFPFRYIPYDGMLSDTDFSFTINSTQDTL